MHALACAYALSPTEESLQSALESCLPLCAMIARRFSGRGAEYDDLYQVACLACVNALKGFDPARGLRFTTFLTPTVTGAVQNYVRDKAGLLRTPRAVWEQAIKLSRAREEYLRAHHEEPTARHLAQALSWDLPRVLSTLSAQSAQSVSSLDQTGPDDKSPLEELPFWERGFEQAEQRADLQRALSGLSDRERELLSLRFGQRMSQREAARSLDMTQMQVARMEKRILSFLRKEMDPPS